jgi:hypothetical protein
MRVLQVRRVLPYDISSVPKTKKPTGRVGAFQLSPFEEVTSFCSGNLIVNWDGARIWAICSILDTTGRFQQVHTLHLPKGCEVDATFLSCGSFDGAYGYFIDAISQPRACNLLGVGTCTDSFMGISTASSNEAISSSGCIDSIMLNNDVWPAVDKVAGRQIPPAHVQFETVRVLRGHTGKVGATHSGRGQQAPLCVSHGTSRKDCVFEYGLGVD